MLGIWKDYEELEDNLSMPELTATLNAVRELEHRNHKFLAAIQGIDIDEGTESDGQKKWEDMKAKVFSGGQASSSDDILSLQGVNAKQAGFGIGAGLEYADLKSKEPENPFG